jgi:acyl-CoA reductase-like NAD-dependent aldehyde dehydrogenase
MVLQLHTEPANTASNGEDTHLQAQIASAVRTARTAQGDWSKTPIRHRLGIIRRFRHLLVERALAMSQALPPKSPAGAVEKLAAEVVPLADACLFLEKRARSLLTPKRFGNRGRPVWLFGVTAEVRREPWGVVLIIGPGNYPLLLTGVQIVQGLVAGNAVVVKPAEGCTTGLQMMADWLVEAGLPAGLVTLIPETPLAGKLATEAEIDKVVLTGSARTGKLVLSQLASRLIPATMELSGCDPVVVLEDAKLEVVSHAVEYGLRWNGSETCIAPRRIFATPAQAKSLEQSLEAAVANNVTPSRSPAAAAAGRLIEAAVAQGAKVLVGGALPDGSGVLPTILTNVRPDMAIAREESFAPVASIIPVAHSTEALQAIRRSPYGLGASIFGPNATAQKVADEVPAGSIVVNDILVPTADPRLPFGGRGASGFGVTRGEEGLLDMTTIKVVSTRHVANYLHLEPLAKTDEGFFLAYLNGFHGKSFGQRLAGRLRFFRMMISKTLAKKK